MRQQGGSIADSYRRSVNMPIPAHVDHDITAGQLPTKQAAAPALHLESGAARAYVRGRRLPGTKDASAKPGRRPIAHPAWRRATAAPSQHGCAARVWAFRIAVVGRGRHELNGLLLAHPQLPLEACMPGRRLRRLCVQSPMRWPAQIVDIQPPAVGGCCGCGCSPAYAAAHGVGHSVASSACKRRPVSACHKANLAAVVRRGVRAPQRLYVRRAAEPRRGR